MAGLSSAKLLPLGKRSVAFSFVIFSGDEVALEIKVVRYE